MTVTGPSRTRASATSPSRLEAEKRALFKNRFNIGVDAKAVAGYANLEMDLETGRRSSRT